MNFRDIDKQALLENAATVSSTITVVGTNVTFTEDDCLVDWKLEDFRYVPNNGFIGQFVERLLDGTLINVPSDTILENSQIELSITIHNGLDDSNHTYDLGTFIITKVNKSDVKGKITYESSDLTKLFNIDYVAGVEFPCTTLELLNDVCTQVGIPYASVGDNTVYVGVVPEDTTIKTSDTFTLVVGDTQYDAVSGADLSFYDSFVLQIDGDISCVARRHDSDDNVSYTIITLTPSSEVRDVVITLTQLPTPDVTSGNVDFVVDGNHFQDMSCRDVIKAIGKLFYSSARIGLDDKLYFDTYDGGDTVVDTYNIIDTEQHYGSVASDVMFGPVEKVVIGMSTVNGENIYYPSDAPEDCVEIGIWDNPITYTEQLRKLSLFSEPALIGLEYMPVEMKTKNHPWLNSNDLVKIIDADGNEYNTYPFDRTINYNGVLSTTISSKGTPSTSDRDYSYDNSMEQRLSRAEVTVNKAEAEVTLMTSTVTQLNKDVAELDVETAGAIEALNKELEGKASSVDVDTKINQVLSTQTDTYSRTEINTILKGSYIDADGNKVVVEKLQTTSATLDENGMHYEKTDAPTSSTINERGFEVQDNSKNDLLYSGYVDDAKATENAKLEDFVGQSVNYSQNSIVDNYFVMGSYTRMEDYEDYDDEGNLLKGTGIFYSGD